MKQPIYTREEYIADEKKCIEAERYDRAYKRMLEKMDEEYPRI
ncbi:hypothetical protein RB2501_01450 [Robiginitalea biformata HTCC2501]|uniref:Uncharacterized protein n=1 Tax=Robiginitalea biformata (strain ATCC BAA-864 / DSM 15991 / KCTC 12146 / HTCC2501) TaxID=313596 RepID=A4CPW5_ROBBH|nr:hypothetical protein RB2501_01450 [Robiginitalea biformata HTCC2501]